MLELHTRQVYTVDATAIKRATKKSNLEETKQKCRLGTARNGITGGLQLVCGRPTLALIAEQMFYTTADEEGDGSYPVKLV